MAKGYSHEFYDLTVYYCITALMQLFATHRLPERIVADNGPLFCSNESAQFLKANGIQHTRSAPYHPSTNGEAERFVQTFNHNMICRGATSANILFTVSEFLLAYRTTAHVVTGMTPSNLLMGRWFSNKSDLLVPDLHMNQCDTQWNQLKQQKVAHYSYSTLVEMDT